MSYHLESNFFGKMFSFIQSNIVRLALLSLLIVFFMPCSAFEKFAAIQTDVTDLSHVMAVFEDKNNDFSPKDIASGSADQYFIPANTQNPNFGFNHHTIYLRIPLHNATNKIQERVISIHYAMIEHVRFFYQTADGLFHESITGLNYPYYQRPIESEYFAFPITLAPNEKQTYYIEAKSYAPYALPVRLNTYKEFVSFNTNKTLFTGIYVGIMASLILYNLFVFFVTRDKAYLFYVLFASGSAISSVIILGFGYQFWPNASLINKHLGTFSLGLLTVMMIQFSRYFLNTKFYMPRYDKVLKYSVYVFSLIAITITLGGFRYTGPLGYYASMTGASLVIGIMVLGVKLRIHAIIFFVLAWGILILTAPFAIYSVIGILPHEPIFMGIYQVGNATEAILLSLALADRINILKQEKRESLKLADEAKALAEAKTHFLATMSHEIRTPMNGILAMSDLLQAANLPPQPKHYANVIHNSGQALLTIINDILDHAKIEAGKMQLEIIPFNLDQLVSGCLGTYAANAREKNISLIADIQPDVPIYLLGDPARIRQILLNFLSNAIKFTQYGEITIRINRIDDEENQQTTLKIAVKDTGVGIQKAVLEKLFQAYTQADQATYRRFGGTGLGLTISRELVELMHGKIGVNSKPSEGSEFWISVPFDIAHPEDVHETALETMLLNGKSILLIEKHTIIAKLIQTTCQYHRMHVDYAKTRTAAIRLLEDSKNNEKPYDFVLMQYKFPGLAKDDVFQGLIKSTSCIFLTEIDQQIKSIQESHIKAVLEKPFTPQALLSTLLIVSQPQATRQTEATLEKVERIMFRDCNVLVAEDNEVNQLVIRTLLEKYGIKPIVVADGQQALNKAKQQHATLDLILMDVEMPELDGLSATKRIRSYEKKNNLDELPIIGLSAHALQEQQDLCLESGMNFYLTKPINQKALQNLLSEILQG